MGATFSRSEPDLRSQYTFSARRSTTEGEIKDSVTMDNNSIKTTVPVVRDIEDGSEEEFFETREDIDDAVRLQSEDMLEFKKQLGIKREQRREIIAKHSAEMENLKQSLEKEKIYNQSISSENKHLRGLLEQHNIEVGELYSPQMANSSELQESLKAMIEDLDIIKDQNKQLRKDLSESNLSLQAANSDIANLNGQNVEFMKQISALKEVVTVSKTMIKIREEQLNELKAKLVAIEQSLADREASLLSADLRLEYERQLQNIRSLRTLYEERARLADVTRLNLLRERDELKVNNAAEVNKCKELTAKIDELEGKINDMGEMIDNKDDQISVTKEETRGLKAEMSTVNKLFSQMLLGYKSQQDLDKLVSRLEEHHGLLTHMVLKENGSESSSALPKLLLDLVSQVDDAENKEAKKDNKSAADSTIEDPSLNTTAEEIVGNLPKVWRVLMELLSHQTAPEEGGVEGSAAGTCYKSVETSAGPVLVPSVSQTYIRLKDLIVEKLSLTKEMNKMKQLNAHLESRLEVQERRLCLVTTELSKTWHVVGRLRRHHHQLHTHEKILRYELQQKRKMLNELKEELEYCREKWDKAKEKNTESEIEWRKLRTEFSNRKSKVNQCSLNNSAESGYSDERQTEDDSSESNDESEYVNDPPVRYKKKTKRTLEQLADSSTDVNHFAEGEDPISDMLEIADLPLDSQETDGNVDKSSIKDGTEDTSICESCESGRLSKSDHSFSFENVNIPENNANVVPVLDNTESAIGKNQIVSLSLSTSENSDKIKDKETLTDENKIPTTETVCLLQITTEIKSNVTTNDDQTEPSSSRTNGKPSDTSVNVTDPIVSYPCVSTDTGEKSTTEYNCTSPAEILENIKRQNERLAMKDKRMKRLEEGCSKLLNKTIHTHDLSNKLSVRLDALQNDRNTITLPNEFSSEVELVSSADTNSTNSIQKPNHEEKESANTAPDKVDNTNEKIFTEEGEHVEYTLQANHKNDTEVEIIAPTQEATDSNSGPSTSVTAMDHEARFAARDERLKRMEELAKSLVNKVNDTTNKSVKITYKLEELHNIYGSDSRNSSPSDDEEDQNEVSK